MPHRIAAIETVRLLALSSTGTAAAATIGLAEQLNAPHDYMNLQLPYWVFLLSMVILNFIGAFLALKTDYMQANGTKVGNFFTASLVGFVLSFFVLPVLNPSSSVGLMQVAAFISGLCGTILLRIVINIMNREDLQNAIVDLIVQQAIKFSDFAIKLFADHAAKVLSAALVGVVASLVLIPKINTSIDNQPMPQQQQVEVSNDNPN